MFTDTYSTPLTSPQNQQQNQQQNFEYVERENPNFHYVDASNLFLNALKNVYDPEQKRKIIGKLFIDVFMEESQKIEKKFKVSWLGQGTIYPDVIESSVSSSSNSNSNSNSVKIKSHHNVGGLPEKLGFKIIEPLRLLFKDEVRDVATELGLPKDFIGRHPFPGPGLAIRILGEVTPYKVNILQQADKIYIDKLREEFLYDKIWQAGAVLLNVKSVGVMGDERTYELTLALRAVNSVDGMTANVYPFDIKFLTEVSTEIINKVPGINRVVYDISTKPPATIEWE